MAFVDINTAVMTSVARLTLTGVVVHLINTCSFEAVIEWLLMARIHTKDGSSVKTNHLTNHLSGMNIRDGSSVWDELGQGTVVRMIIRLYINTSLLDGSSVQTNYPR